MIHRTSPHVTILAFVILIALLATPAFSAPTLPPRAYAIAEITVTDPEAYQQYIAAVTPVVAQFQGKYLVRAGAVVSIEGEAPTGRVIVIEFPSLAAAQAFEASPQYRAIAPLRQKASRTRLFLVEGAPQP